MHSFFIKPGAVSGDIVLLDIDESRHASKVLRLIPGDTIRLIDGQGHAFEGSILSCSPGETSVSIGECLPSHESPVKVTVYEGYPKADKLEFIAQKLTETGVSALIPLVMRYSVAKPKAGHEERLERISKEAVKQCGRSSFLRIHPPIPFDKALPLMKEHDLMLMPWENAHERTILTALREHPYARDVGILIGPEGGISPEEAEAAVSAGAVPVTLGDRILRTETACVACAVLTMAFLEEQAEKSK